MIVIINGVTGVVNFSCMKGVLEESPTSYFSYQFVSSILKFRVLPRLQEKISENGVPTGPTTPSDRYLCHAEILFGRPLKRRSDYHGQRDSLDAPSPTTSVLTPTTPVVQRETGDLKTSTKKPECKHVGEH